MIFTTGFLNFLVYGALIWCGISALALGLMMIRDMIRGESW